MFPDMLFSSQLNRKRKTAISDPEYPGVCVSEARVKLMKYKEAEKVQRCAAQCHELEALGSEILVLRRLASQSKKQQPLYGGWGRGE